MANDNFLTGLSLLLHRQSMQNYQKMSGAVRAGKMQE